MGAKVVCVIRSGLVSGHKLLPGRALRGEKKRKKKMQRQMQKSGESPSGAPLSNGLVQNEEVS